jgi:hypothetical protein
MSDQIQSGMTPAQALRLEALIIGLGLLALVLIFQPFSLALFGIGSGLVVLAALVNNLLPLAEPGVPARSVAIAALLVAAIFCVVLLVAIAAAHLYGVFFLKPPNPDTPAGQAALAAAPFYAHPLVWSLAAIAAALRAAIAWLMKRP